MGDNGPHTKIKGGGELMSSWKVCAAVVIFWLKRGVVLHDALHVFRVGQGMGTATLEANLNQWLYRKAHKSLSVFFINQQGV